MHWGKNNHNFHFCSAGRPCRSPPLQPTTFLMVMSTFLEASTSTGVLGCAWQKTSTLSIVWPGLTSHRPTFSAWSSFLIGWVASTDFIASSADRHASKCSGNSFCCPSAAWHRPPFNFSSVCTSIQRKFLNNSLCPTGVLLMMPVMNVFLVNTFLGVLLLQSSSPCSASHSLSHFHFSIAITCWFRLQTSTQVCTRTTVAGGALWISFVDFS